ncbi:MAG: hypothetical protein ACFB0C_04925 [Leptolyngbyaceae cyanobacterium]
MIIGIAPDVNIVATAAETISEAQAKSTSTISASVGITDLVYIATGETLAYPLTVNSPVNVNGLLVPPGSVIPGEFRPVAGGSQYFADRVLIGGNPYPLSVTSDLINDFKDPRETTFGATLGDALIGAAAGAALGPIGAVGGALIGAIIGNVSAPQVVELMPNQTLTLYVQ